MTTYAAGLRVSKLCALELTDIESAPDRMCLKVRAAKGGKEPRVWLFPNAAADGPMGVQTAQRLYWASIDAAGLAAAGGIHTLRKRSSTPERLPASGRSMPFD